jgi:hypothetical protein
MLEEGRKSFHCWLCHDGTEKLSVQKCPECGRVLFEDLSVFETRAANYQPKQEPN